MLYHSIAGSALSVLVYSLLLMPLETVKPLLPSLQALLPTIDRLNRVLPAVALLEEQELEWPVQGEPWTSYFVFKKPYLAHAFLGAMIILIENKPKQLC